MKDIEAQAPDSAFEFITRIVDFATFTEYETLNDLTEKGK